MWQAWRWETPCVCYRRHARASPDEAASCRARSCDRCHARLLDAPRRQRCACQPALCVRPHPPRPPTHLSLARCSSPLLPTEPSSEPSRAPSTPPPSAMQFIYAAGRPHQARPRLCRRPHHLQRRPLHLARQRHPPLVSVLDLGFQLTGLICSVAASRSAAQYIALAAALCVPGSCCGVPHARLRAGLSRLHVGPIAGAAYLHGQAC